MKSIFIKLITIIFCISASYSSIFSQSITGKITSKSEEGLRGTNIKILNSNLGTITDVEGNFKFNKVPSGYVILEISAIGFQQKYRKLR